MNDTYTLPPATFGPGGDAQAVIDAVERLSDSDTIDDDGRFVAIPKGKEVIDLEQLREQFREAPRRKRGTYKVHSVQSFADFVAKHGDEDTEVWADALTHTLTAVLDANGHADHAGPRWEQHRAVFVVALSDAWKEWTKHDGKLLTQQDFAEHIEARAIDVVEPSGADMLELAQTFQATIGVNFESSKLLSSGERQLEYRETVDAKAGRAGRMDIPAKFTLVLIPFEGAQPVRIAARLRYRISDGTLRLGYRLDRPEDTVRAAFEDVVDDTQRLLAGGCTVYRGAAPTGS